MREDLLRRAKASLRGVRTREGFLRRAVSDAYYALFHAIAAACADTIVGARKRSTDAWRRVYRGIDHTKSRDDLRLAASVSGSPPALATIAAAFVAVQSARHAAADYDPRGELVTRADAETYIALAESAIGALDRLPDDVLLDLATILIVKRRN